jgi:hypothetical protein
LKRPEEAEKIRDKLREYYTQLKACDEHLSFVFVTGITTFVQGGLYSAFNNPIDISFEPEYGAITGFTEVEIKHYFKNQIEKSAKTLGMSPKSLFDKIKDYYNGFCFDGETFVYNPFSLALFFRKNEFDNFWFNTGSSEQLTNFFKNSALTVEEFRGIKVGRDRIVNPRAAGTLDRPVYLFQMGMLSLKKRISTESYILDYPNTEVLETMSRRLLESWFGEPDKAETVRLQFKDAFLKRDPAALVAQFNMLLASVPYVYYQREVRDEHFYSLILFTLLYGAGLKPRAETLGSGGRSDLLAELGPVAWVMEAKVAPNEQKEKEKVKEAMDQIEAKNYGGRFLNPVLFGFVVNDENKKINVWECRGGIQEGPEEKPQK